MTDIIELAKEAGFTVYDNERRAVEGEEKNLERFAALVRAEREWVDLTDDEINKLWYDSSYGDSGIDFARAVIAVFKEKNK